MVTLSEEAREAKNNYQREYRRKNPEKLKQHLAAYWERRAAREAEAERIRIQSWLDSDRCKVCGIELLDTRKDAKFCSATCRQKYHRQHKGGGL